MRIKVPVVPASFFGMVLGLAGLGTAWRWARRSSRAGVAATEYASDVRYATKATSQSYARTSAPGRKNGRDLR